jgi:Transposase zinc-ribbon domain
LVCSRICAIMAVSDLVNLSALLDEAKCFELVRQHRWPEGVRCPGCHNAAVVRNGRDDGECQGSCRLNSVMIPPIDDAAGLAA